MKRAHWPVIALLATSAGLAAPPAAAWYRCDNPQGVADRRACEKAAEGPTALRRFIERTQAVYQLYYWDYLPQQPDRMASAPTTRLASNAAPRR